MTDCRILFTDWVHEQGRLSRIRRMVFIEEQGVPEDMEWDADDAGAMHLLAIDTQGQAVGCARLLPDGHIGRMAVLPAWRGQGIGRALLAAAMKAAQTRGLATLRISAQVHAAGFYESAGFIAVGDDHVEAGIPHRTMQKILN
jgi:predicted GNAT family N-acyltransferase